MSVLAKCERIRACEDEAGRLRREVEQETGRSYEEFLAGMRELLEPVGGWDSVEPVTYRLVGGEVDPVLA